MLNRRRLIQTAAASATALFAPGVFAAALARKPTAFTTEGPFYPDKLPLDTDNDLIVINDAITPAVGQITHLTGRVLSDTGAPVRNAIVEIWQVDNKASYIHSRGENTDGRDGNFQGYGKFLTDSEGRYYFRTIKPVSYRLINIFRPPHIHVAVSKSGRRILTTQLLTRGEPSNDYDAISRMLPKDELETILADYVPVKGSKLNELQVNWDCIIDRTAAETDDGKLRGTAPSNSPFGR